MKVFIERTKEEVEAAPSSVAVLLASLKINPEEVLVMKNGSLVVGDEVLADADEIKVLSVISGG